jgi:hypothetical protein
VSAASTTSSGDDGATFLAAVLSFEFRKISVRCCDPHNHEDLGVVILLASLQLPLCTITTDPKQLCVHSYEKKYWIVSELVVVIIPL